MPTPTFKLATRIMSAIEERGSSSTPRSIVDYALLYTHELTTDTHHLEDEGYFDIQNQYLVQIEKDEPGHPPKRTLLALDATGNRSLYRQLIKKVPPDRKACFDENFNRLTLQPFSLIPIQKEMYFHILHICHGVTSDPLLARQAFEYTFAEIYPIINQEITNYLGSHPNTSVGEFNEFLDKHRVHFAAMAEASAVSYLRLHNAPFRTKKERTRRLERETAEDMDIISTNRATTGLLTYIHGTQQSSHDKKNSSPAFMHIETFSLSSKKLLQRQTRTPSLVDQKNQTVTEQISTFMKHVFVKNEDDLGIYDLKPRIYHLLTSYPNIDLKHQTDIAINILMSAHQYNRTTAGKASGDMSFALEKDWDTEEAFEDAYARGRNKPPKFYVMNLPINQHSRNLSYDSQYPENQEALLMADFAMLYSFFPEDGTGPEALYDEWLLTLNDENKKPVFFSSSPQGQAAIRYFKDLKKQIRTTTLPTNPTRDQLLIRAVMKLYAQYFDDDTESQTQHQQYFGGLIQAGYAVFTNHDLLGCQSASERFGHIKNLHELLLAYKAGTLNPTLTARIQTALQRYTAGKISAEDFAQEIHSCNDQSNFYNAGVLPSCLDTGTPKGSPGSSKKSKPLSTGWTPSTNVFLPSLYQSPHQTSSHEMQMHYRHHYSTQSRLTNFIKLSERRVRRYEKTYAQYEDSPLELAHAVLGDYANGYHVNLHFQQEVKDFLHYLAKSSDDETSSGGDLTLQDKIRLLEKNITQSKYFNEKTSSLYSRILFLKSKIPTTQETTEHTSTDPISKNKNPFLKYTDVLDRFGLALPHHLNNLDALSGDQKATLLKLLGELKQLMAELPDEYFSTYQLIKWADVFLSEKDLDLNMLLSEKNRILNLQARCADSAMAWIYLGLNTVGLLLGIASLHHFDLGFLQKDNTQMGSGLSWNYAESVGGLLIGIRQIIQGEDAIGAANISSSLQLAGCTILVNIAKYSQLLPHTIPSAFAASIMSFSFALCMAIAFGIELHEIKRCDQRIEHLEAQLFALQHSAELDKKSEPYRVQYENLRKAILIEKADKIRHERSAASWLACTLAMTAIAVLAFLVLNSVSFGALPAATVIIAVTAFVSGLIRKAWVNRDHSKQHLKDALNPSMTEEGSASKPESLFYRLNAFINTPAFGLNFEEYIKVPNRGGLGTTEITLRIYLDSLLLKNPEELETLLSAHTKQRFLEILSEERIQFFEQTPATSSFSFKHP